MTKTDISDCFPESSLPEDSIGHKLSSNQYDIIVIGSGIGGLTAAALLARAGKSVLVLEQHDRPGGYAHAFKRKRFLFDSGVHITSGCGLTGYPGGQVLRRTLQAAKVFDELEFIQVNPFAYADYPGIQLALPTPLEAFQESLAIRFPEQRQGIIDLLALCKIIAIQASYADSIMAKSSTQEIPIKLAELIQYRHTTLAEVFSKFIDAPQLKSIIATHWPYLGLPPSKLSFVYWAVMMISYLEDGAYYCRGGFQKLAEALVNGLTKHGGTIRFKSQVQNIKVSDNQVHSVILSNGELIAAPTIIVNSDVRSAIFQMIGAEYFPKRYLARLNKMQTSLSIFVVYIATDLNLQTIEPHHEAFHYNNFDHESNYLDSKQGKLSWISITIPSLLDNSLAPKGTHIVMLTTLVDYQAADWVARKSDFAEQMLDFADQKLPGLKQHTLLIEAGSPLTLERYTSNFKGAAYGWAMTPEQTGANRLANRTPIDGLYFAGHWSAPGGGVYGVNFSGVQTAQEILGIRDQLTFWELFEEITP